MAIQKLKPIQLGDWLFRSCELNGRKLLLEGLISVADIEEWILKEKCEILSIKLPAYCILQCLLSSAKSESSGFIISDEVELTEFNWPDDKVLKWFLGPLLIMKDQIKRLSLNEDEEACLSKLIMECNNEKPEDWKDGRFPSDDNVRKAQLQAIIRRLKGMVVSMSRMPTFRRRFRNLVKALYVGAVAVGAVEVEIDTSSQDQDKGSSKLEGQTRSVDRRYEQEEKAENNLDEVNIV